MPNYVSTSKDVGMAKSGGGGNSANIGNQAIRAYGNQRTVAPSAGGGRVTTPAQARATANVGSQTRPQRDINQPPQNAVYGYTPGGFDDPTIDWQAIYDAMVAPQLAAEAAAATRGSNFSPAQGNLGGGYSPVEVAPPAPEPVFQQPQTFTATSPATPAVVTAQANSTPDAPTGQSFSLFGNPSTFGGYERIRNARSPMTGGSVTPEMLRRAAQARLG